METKNKSDMKPETYLPLLLKQRVSNNDCSSIARKISAELKIHFVTAYVLAQRGVNTIDDAKAFLTPTLRHHLPNPATLKNANKAVECICSAIKDNKYITLFSDFDVDGITSASQLWLVLAAAGAKIRHYVPNRMTEGYGLSVEAIEKLKHEKTELLVTLDCGITNVKEVERAKELGLDVIVVDHHELGESVPPADIIVNPMQEECPFRNYKMATAGIAWLLSILMIKELEKEEFKQKKVSQLPSSKDLLDLAAIGTICDMVPLVGVNRLIASRGIDSIRNQARLGIKSLKEIAGLPIGSRFSCSNISFGIGPRLNAAGRLKDASLGFKLLTSGSTSETKKLAKTIHTLNQERRGLEDHAKEVCLSIIEELHSERDGVPLDAYALYDDSFHLGVIGIAAQRIVEKLGRPVAVMGPGEGVIDGKTVSLIKGSVRSIPEFHVADALGRLTNLLCSHGGHAEAGGFSILPENLSKFQTSFNEIAKEQFSKKPPQKIIRIDYVISFKDIDIKLVQEVQSLAPFGVGNPSPVFLAKNVYIENVRLIGENHVKMELSQDSTTRNAIAWRMRGHPLIMPRNSVDLIFSLELNTYKGVTSVQLIVKDILEPDPEMGLDNSLRN